MIPISLPSGKVAFITFEQSLDEGFMNDLIAKDEGYEIDHPFDSQLDRMRDSEWNLPDVPKLSKKDEKRIERDAKKESEGLFGAKDEEKDQ